MRTTIRPWAVPLHGLIAGLAAVAVACAPTSGAPGPTSAPAKPAAASKPAEAAQPAAKSGGEVSLKVGLAGVASAIYAPVHAAADRGIFAKNGLKVEITDYNSGSATQEALAAGEADIIHYFPPGIATAVSKGVKQKIIASDQFKPTDWHIVVSTKSTIQGPQDLAGKKIGVTAKGSTTDFFALWFAQKTGVSVEIVPLGGTALYPSVVGGQIDAAVLTPPLVYQGFDKNDLRSAFAFEKEMEPNLPSALAASDKIIAEQPDGVSRYLKSLFESIRTMKQDADYCGTFIAKHTNQERPIADRVCKNITAQLSDDGHIRREWLDNSLDLAKLGGMTDLPPADQFFTDRFTPVKLD